MQRMRTSPVRIRKVGGCTAGRAWRGAARRGVVLVKVALLMPVLIGMLGLVIDVGLLLSAHRQTSNAADAAALAAAMEKVCGRSDSDALDAANRFVLQHSAFATPSALVSGVSFNIPPSSGPHSGDRRFVEVIATQQVESLFVQVLGGANRHTVQARAVAGYQPVGAGEAVMVLDRTAIPGLGTSGGTASIKVNGRIVINSEGGGVDENGVSVPGTGYAAAAGAGGIYGTDISIVGGVNNLADFHPYVSTEPLHLRCRQLPEPDPLIRLPAPTTAYGALNVIRGRVSASDSGASFDPLEEGDPKNHIAAAGEILGSGLYTAAGGEVILYPGIYRDLAVQGGTVILMPGIYIIAANKTNDGIQITGGTVTAQGVMIYSTGSNYDPVSGTPDINDGESPLPATDGAIFGSVALNASLQISPIDTKKFSYATLWPGAQAVSSAFDGMLFYQRRRNNSAVTITGNATAGALTGTLYSKWGRLDISGQGTYDAQFICGSMDCTGQGEVTILASGKLRGKANQVFLVE